MKAKTILIITLIAALFVFVCAALTSCTSLPKKLNKAKHLIEDNGGYALLNVDSLPGECNKQFPCITTQKESTEKTEVKIDPTNDSLKNRIREMADSIISLKKKKVDVSNPDSCQAAIEYYETQLGNFAREVKRLNDQIRNSTNTLTTKLEKQTIESTAKLVAANNETQRMKDSADHYKAKWIQSETNYQSAKDQVATYQQNEQNIIYILKLLWDWAMWYIIIAAVLFGLYKFRKFIPVLKLIP